MATESDGTAARRQPDERTGGKPERPADADTGQMSRLIHELQVHQIELETQNEELRRTHLELEISRDRYARLYDFSPVGYLTLGPGNIILEANLTLASMLEIDRPALLDKPFHRYVYKDDQDAWNRWLAELAGTEATLSCDCRLATHSGQVRHARLEAKSYQDPPAIRIAVTDTTERKRAETLRADMERRLLHAQRLESLGVLAGGIAHDFNNLLTVIFGRMDLALRLVPAGSPIAKNINDAMEASTRAAELTRQMLDFAGKGNPVLRSIDLSRLVRESASLFRASIARTVEMREKLAPGLPSILGDEGQMQQVAMNLISNASEAIGERTGMIRIATGVVDCDEEYLSRSQLEEKPEPGRYVFLDVTDDGAGMDRATIERLFEPFFTTKFLGRGLGMSAVMGIVRRHGGAILVDSEGGVGTTIRVLFPAEGSDRITASQPAPQQRHEVQTPFSGTVLVVDDEPAIRELCRNMLENLGLRVITAADGEEAVRVFSERASEISCVILDLTMPRMDGATAFGELKCIRPDVKVILVSGYSEPQAAQRFTGESPAAFIQKPYLPAVLAAKLRELLPGG